MKRAESDSALRHTIAKNLWTELEDQGITQKDLAKQIGVSDSTLANILWEKSTPSISTIAEISKALLISIDYLCGLSDER